MKKLTNREYGYFYFSFTYYFGKACSRLAYIREYRHY